jgi:hypothetical protein
VRLACGRQVGIPRLVVFLNKCDMVNDEELLELVEMEGEFDHAHPHLSVSQWCSTWILTCCCSARAPELLRVPRR